MANRFVILGAPGAGKGTQAKRLSQTRGVPHISSGDMFRQHREQGTELGKLAEQFLREGRLVPDDVTCRMIEDRLTKPDCRDGFILDGFPRSVPQAEALEALMKTKKTPLTATLAIDVPDDEIVIRLTSRRTCKKCGAIYNLKYSPPAGDPNQCDRPGCGGELVHRVDDKEETIRERLKVYHGSTTPLYGFYGQRGLLYLVPADALSPDDVFDRINDILVQLEAV